MSAFGVDLQDTLIQVVLREGASLQVRHRSIGDGIRDVIPCFAAGDAIGERAVRALGAASTPAAGDEFWRAVRARLSAFLGRVDPTARNGYSFCFAISPSAFEARQKDLARTLASSGWEQPLMASSPCALAATTLVSEHGRVVAIVVGEHESSMQSFDVDAGARRLSAAGSATIVDVGMRAWEGELLRTVTQRARHVPPIDALLKIEFSAAAMEFATGLSRAPRDQPVLWQGPLAHAAFLELALSSDDCMQWPSVRQLDQAIAAFFKFEPSPDVVVVGGVGAAWPFAASAASRFGRIWPSGAPSEEVARGAAYLATGKVSLDGPPFAMLPPAVVPEPEVPDGPRFDEEQTPPWLRGRRRSTEP